MDQSEYDRLYRRGSVPPEADDPQREAAPAPALEGDTVIPPRQGRTGASSQAQHAQEQQLLQEDVQVVGRLGDERHGVDLVRRRGGAYDHGAAWRDLMRRCGRFRG